MKFKNGDRVLVNGFNEIGVIIAHIGDGDYSVFIGKVRRIINETDMQKVSE